jgi:hypothetical protein
MNFTRVINTNDNIRDAVLDETPRTLLFSIGRSYGLEKHEKYEIVKNIRFLNKQICMSGCLECFGP